MNNILLKFNTKSIFSSIFFLMDFNENLKYYMTCKGFQTKDLSSKTGINIDTINSYLKTKGSLPNIINAQKISKALEISMEELAGEKRDFIKKQNITEQIHSTNPEILEIVEQLSDFTQKDLSLISKLVASIHQKYSKN